MDSKVKAIGKFKEITFGRNGEQIVSFVLRSDISSALDELKDKDLDIEVKRHREKRSMSANSYCWVLCTRIADKLCNDGTITTKEDVYRAAIKDVGVYRDFEDLPIPQAGTLRHAWEMLGTGWITEQVDWSQDRDHVTVRCYYGSSQYNTKQMSRLIDNLVQDCQALDIPTETPEYIDNLKSLWATAPQEKE